MTSVTPAPRARGYARRVQARVSGVMRQETFSGPDADAVEKAARQFAAVVDRLGWDEAVRVRDARQGKGRKVVTLADWIDRYMDPDSGLWTGIGAGYRERSRRMAEATIKPVLGPLPVDAIDEKDVTRWVTAFEKPGADGKRPAAKTVRNHHGLLSQILAAAAAAKLRDGNPARGAKIRRTRREPMVILTQGEFAVLLHFVPERWKPIVLWQAGTGMRWGETTALTWGDLDRDARPMMVSITKAWTDDDEGGGRVLGPPKTEAGERTISVPDELVAALGKPGRGDALVFATRNGTALWSGSFWTRVWTPALDAANDPKTCEEAGLTPIGKRPRVHDLRHSHASWLIRAGRPLPYIQRRLGHDDIRTTIKVYGHLMPDALQGDADAVGEAMGAVLPRIEKTTGEPVAGLPAA